MYGIQEQNRAYLQVVYLLVELLYYMGDMLSTSYYKIIYFTTSVKVSKFEAPASQYMSNIKSNLNQAAL